MDKRIVLNSIGHHFTTQQGRISLFNDLSLQINSNQSYAIVGPSGTGKSSLLLILAGLEQPAAGSVDYFNASSPMSLNQLKQDSGFIFQQFQLLSQLDAVSNVALPLKLKGDKQANAIARQWLERVGLGHRLTHKPNELSGGEQQRVAIARAFVAEPSFVFADEPTGNLDQTTATQIVELMFECQKVTKCALIIVTHNESLAQRADRCYQLNEGQLTRQIEPMLASA